MILRELASKHEVSLAYVNKTLQENNVKAFKKEIVPHATDAQKDAQRMRVKKLYKHLLECDGGSSPIVMDDEAYFTLAHHCIPRNQYYYATERGDAPDHVRQSSVKKLEMRLLVWIAISQKSISQPVFWPSGEAVKKVTYSQ